MKTRRAFSFFALVLVLIMLLSSCGIHVPEPRIREGRFNFSVTYSVHGKLETISGVYVCKFKRVDIYLDGVSRIWDGYIENSDIEDESRYEVLTNEDGVIYLDLGLNPEYFMSDPFYDSAPYINGGGEPEASVFIVYHDDISLEMGGFSTDPVLLERYGVRVISWEYDEPIENVYE